ncbi:MAG: AAA family ATPase [Solirubrobacterales bacterium]|nr:AAA family ATPase [Solirubrobacterales bacterium]
MTVIPDPGTRRERGSPARPLLERDAELATLSALIEAARSDDGRLVVIEGPAGIGKTRLLAEARSLAAEFEVLSARAGELESDFAFGIARQLFEGALLGVAPEVRDELLSGAARLAAPLFVDVPGQSEPGGTVDQVPRLLELGGAALRRANSRSDARQHLRDGIDLAHQCGATALVNQGNDELAATGAHPRKVMRGLESLTASERRVAQMAAEDVSNKEIAQALFVTVKTVEVHLSRVYRKLDIESRRQLAGALSAPAADLGATAR